MKNDNAANFGDFIGPRIGHEPVGDMPLELDLTRRVVCDEYCEGAYTEDSLSAWWSYGKGQDFPTAAEGVKQIAEQVKPYLDQCTSCTVVIYGEVSKAIILKENGERFYHDFNGNLGIQL